MDITEQEIEASAVRATRARRVRALGTGAVTLLVAATLAACGGDDSSSEETTASTGTTAAQSETTESADTGSGEDNGVAELSADEILAEARDAAAGATAVHVSGEAEGTMLDLSLVRDEGGSGRIAAEGAEFEIVAVDGSAYLQAGDRFWEQFGGDAVAQLLAGRWLRVSVDDENFGSFAELTDMDMLIDQAINPGSSAEITKGEVEDRDGQQVVPLRGERGTLYVAATGEPFPLAIDQNSGDGTITFDAWNEPTDLSAPEDAIDVSELERLGASSSN